MKLRPNLISTCTLQLADLLPSHSVHACVRACVRASQRASGSGEGHTNLDAARRHARGLHVNMRSFWPVAILKSDYLESRLGLAVAERILRRLRAFI